MLETLGLEVGDNFEMLVTNIRIGDSIYGGSPRKSYKKSRIWASD